MRLNGWQRLWCVFAVLYGIIVGFFTWEAWPERSLLRRLSVAAEDSGQRQTRELLWGGDELPTEATLEAIWQRRPDDRSNYVDVPLTGGRSAEPPYVAVTIKGTDQVAYFPTGTYEFQMERELERYVNGAWPERRAVLGTAFAAWSIPLVFLYGLGSAIGWVSRGFRPHSRN